MQYTRLGRTNLMTSVAGLGCGGRSRLGISRGLGEDNAIKIIKKAFNLGINFFDTAAMYKTEEVLGKGLLGIKRDEYIISSKFSPSNFSDELLDESSLMKSLESSLLKLKTDYIDVFLLHGVSPDEYIESRDRFYPQLVKAQEQGKIRYVGVSEYFNRDTKHDMSIAALKDDIWDVMMIGYNMLNSSARKKVLPLAEKNDVGILDMFAVRVAFSDENRLIEIMKSMQKTGEIDKRTYNVDDPLDFLTMDKNTKSTMDAAYRFCRHSKGIDIVLTGTSSVDHLVDNVDSILSPPLSNEVLKKINDIFGKVDSASGQ